MSKLLAVIANPRNEEDSISRRMLKSFLKKYQEKKTEDLIEEMDLYREVVPNLTDDYIKLMYGRIDPAQASKETKSIVKRSDYYIDKIKEANKIVIVVPMWNFSVPPVFKSYVDLLIFPGKTFKFSGPGQPEGLLKEKKLLCLGARGGVYSKEPYKALDSQESWIKNVFAFMGITDFSAIWAEGMNYFQGEELMKAQSAAFEKAGKEAESF